jgi:hypothetical protein
VLRGHGCRAGKERVDAKREEAAHLLRSYNYNNEEVRRARCGAVG